MGGRQADNFPANVWHSSEHVLSLSTSVLNKAVQILMYSVQVQRSNSCVLFEGILHADTFNMDLAWTTHQLYLCLPPLRQRTSQHAPPLLRSGRSVLVRHRSSVCELKLLKLCRLVLQRGTVQKGEQCHQERDKHEP